MNHRKQPSQRVMRAADAFLREHSQFTAAELAQWAQDLIAEEIRAREELMAPMRKRGLA